MNKLDIFGSQIQFYFKGQRAYNTSIGSFFTIAIATIVSIRLVMIVNDIYERKEPTVIFKERQVSSPEQFIMNNYTLPFAFGMQDGTDYTHYLDPTIYNVNAYQLTKKSVLNSKGEKEDKWSSTNAKVQACNQDNFENPNTRDSFLEMPINTLYCLEPSTEVIIEGDYSQDIFEQFVIEISPCKGSGCKTPDELKAKLGKGYFAIYFSDVIVDPVIKDEPFKFYNRDLFWVTSTTSPKAINMYFRNNYIESDYGWVTEDLQEKRYISYSNSDLSVTEGTEYFLQVILRFEKQKENVYTRKYKNLTNIISEIGGFTQSMLAIGFIICTQISELMLNKSIINDAFNFKTSESQKKGNHRNNNSLTVGNQNNNLPKNSGYSQQNKISEQVEEEQRGNSFFKQDEGAGTKDQQTNNQQQDVQRPTFLNVIQSKLTNQKSIQSLNMNSNNNEIQSKVQSNINLQQQNEQLSSPSKNQRLKSKVFEFMNKQNNQAILSSIIQNKLTKVNEDQNDQQANIQDSNKNLSRKKTRYTINESKQIQPSEISNDQFKKLLHKETNSMKLSVLEYLKYFFWPFGEIKRKKQIIDYSIQKLYHHLDVIYVVQKLLEVDKLKKIIMDTDQIKLFEYLPKPTISDENVFNDQNNQIQQQESDILYQDTRTEIQKAQDAYQAYQNIQRRDKKTAIDQKILTHLDPHLLNLFNYREGAQDNQQTDQNRDGNTTNQMQNNQNPQNIQSPVTLIMQDNCTTNRDQELVFMQKDQLISPRSDFKFSLPDRYFDDLDIDDKIPGEDANKNTTDKQLEFAKNPMSNNK